MKAEAWDVVEEKHCMMMKGIGLFYVLVTSCSGVPWLTPLEISWEMNNLQLLYLGMKA